MSRHDDLSSSQAYRENVIHPEVERMRKEKEAIDNLMSAFVDDDISFDHAKVLLVNRMHVTFGEAERRLLFFEEISGKTLQR